MSSSLVEILTEGFARQQQAWKQGNLAGLYDALVQCETRRDMERNDHDMVSLVPDTEDSIKVPRWVLDGVLRWLRIEITNKNRQCPTHKWNVRYKRDLEVLNQYETLQDVRDDEVVTTDGKAYDAAAELVNDKRRLLLGELDRLGRDHFARVPAPATKNSVHRVYKMSKEIEAAPGRFYRSKHVVPRTY